jgi:hypothetical protein
MKVVWIVGIILVVLGAFIVLASALGDRLVWGAPGFGLRQIAGIVVGAIDIVLGLVLIKTKK